MSKAFLESTLNTTELGGGTIKRRSACALLLVLTMAMCIFPSFGGTVNQVASDDNAKIGLNKDIQPLEVNAASKYKKSKKKIKTSKKKSKKKKKSTKKKYKKAKASYKYKKTVYKSYTCTSSSAFKNDPKLNSIMISGSKFRYSGAHHTGAELVKYGSGDCWAMSDYLNTQFTKAGYQSRIIQYPTSYSSRHRYVQVYIEGTWQTVPYRSYGYHYLFV